MAKERLKQVTVCMTDDVYDRYQSYKTRMNTSKMCSRMISLKMDYLDAEDKVRDSLQSAKEQGLSGVEIIKSLRPEVNFK